MSAREQAPHVEDLAAVLESLGTAGTVDHIAKGVADVARAMLTGRPLAVALARLHAITTAPEFAQGLAADMLACTGPLAQTDAAGLEAAMTAAATVHVFALGEEICLAIGGA